MDVLLTSDDVRDENQDDANDEVKYSTLLIPIVDCWKQTMMLCYLVPAEIAGPFRTMKIHCSYHQIHFHIVELLSRFHCFLNF